ncbi:MAG: LysR family transcriptional regulator [Dermatophilaceae bacterium]
MPELRQLRVFVAVAEELNFTRAARRLHLGQQGVSKSVRALERELGVPLLRRTTREVSLTAAGKALLRSGVAVLAAADTAFAEACHIGAGEPAGLAVGVSPALSYGERDAVLAALREDADHLAVALVEVWPPQALAMLRRRELDLLVTRVAPGEDDVESIAIGSSRAHVYVPSGHRLAESGGAVEPADLDGERLLTWNAPGTPHTDLLLDRLAQRGARMQPVLSRVAGSAVSLADLVDLDAVAIAPAGLHHDDDVVELDLAREMALPLQVAWLAGAVPPAVRRLADAAGVRLPPTPTTS